jgi:hypothetical protein
MTFTKRFVAVVALTTVAAAGLVGIAAPASAVAPTGTPALLSPEAGALVKGNPTLSWSAVPGAVKYRVQIYNPATPSTLLYNTDTYTLRATPPTDLPLGLLSWRVAATDGSAGIGPFAEAQFTKAAATQPTLQSPADGAQLTYPTTAPVLRWSPVPGVKNFRIELDDADDFIQPTAFTTSNTSLALAEPLTLDKDYFWRVQGVSATNGVTTDWSTAWRFRVVWPSADGRPILESPVGGTAVDVTDVVFRWSAVPGAKNYQIQVSPNGDWANNRTDDKVVFGTQYSPTTTYNNATYFWRVRAQDTATKQGQGPWSDVALFKRSWLPQPSLLAPRDGASAATPRFEWTPIPHASSYELEISTDPNFSSLYATCETLNTSVTPMTTGAPHSNTTCGFSLNIGSHYYWRVRGLDLPSGVLGIRSAATDFFYLPASMPTVAGPTNGTSTPAPVLSWQALPGFSKYRVKVIRTSTGVEVSSVDTYATSYTPTAALVAGEQYSWYVVGLTSAGKIGMAPGAHRTFTAAAPTAAPSLDPIAASNDNQFAMPSMTWQPLAGASYYKVYSGVAGSGIFDATPLSGTTKLYQPAFTHAGTVLTSGSYDWYVVAYSAAGAVVDNSSTGTFTIVDLGFTQPVSPPNCVLPECAAVRIATPELSWQHVVGAGVYRVHVALDVNFTNEVHSYTTENTTLTPRESYLDNEAGQSYFWYVQPCKAKVGSTFHGCGPFEGDSLAERVQAFRKASEPIELLGPVNGATELDDVPFRWKDYREPGTERVGAKAYHLQVASDDEFRNVVDDVTVDAPFYTAWEKSYPDGVYYWRVQAVDEGAAALTYSPTWQFQKSASSPVPATALPGENTGLPTLTWGAMPYASGYSVEVYSGTSPLFPSGSKIGSTITTKLPAYTPKDPLAAGQYSWRVRKLDPSGNPGPWSTTVPTFTVLQPAPALTAPDDGAGFATNDLLFSWQGLAGASAYRFESSTSDVFATVLERKDTVMTSWAPTAAYVDGTRYWWRVRVLDGGGNVMADSLKRSFTKDSAAPRVTAVSPTTKLAVDGTITVTFSEPVKGVSTTSLTLRAAGSTAPLAGTVATPTTSPGTATFRPTSPLIPGQYYDVVADAGITDLMGNAIVPATTRVRAVQALENTSPAVSHRWDVDGATAASGGAYISSKLGGTTATFTFTGTDVKVIGRASAGGGNADVLIDGVRQAGISFYNRTDVYKKLMYSKSGLSNAPHTLTVKVLGTKAAAASATNVDIDAFQVGGTLFQESSPAVTTRFLATGAATASAGSYDRAVQDRDPSGAEYRFTFRGTGFTWTATKLPSGGSAGVYVNGVYKGTVSQYSKLPAYKAPVYSASGLVDGVYNVRLVLTGVVPAGSSGTYVSLDSVTTR